MKTSLITITILTISLMSCGDRGQPEETLLTPEVTKVEQEVGTPQVSSSQPSVSSPEGSSENTNWDSILDDYEEYVTDYVKLMKKANEGDMSAMTEYMGMLEKATSLSEKLENASDDLSTAQMTRFARIQEKITNAALGMI